MIHYFDFDGLTAIMAFLILSIYSVIMIYSRRYFDGEQSKSKYFFILTFTAASTLAFVASQNLLVLFLCWQMVSFGLHNLLLYFKERTGARQAAREKFIVSRIGDIFLLVAIICTYFAFGTLNIKDLRTQLAAGASPLLQIMGLEAGAIDVSALFFVLGAMTKSAQFPFQNWLPKTMEAPTTVSAFMHAGIINAGGFLIIRLSPLVAHAPVAMHVLFVMGLITAIYGGLVMLTQSQIKQRLAYSTIGQMGFMMLQCGLGAFTAALFHLVMHGFYKAYGFLSASSDVFVKSRSKNLATMSQSPLELVSSQGVFFLVAIALLHFAMLLLGLDWEEKEGGIVLMVFYAITIAQVLRTGWHSASQFTNKIKGVTIAAAVSYSVLLGYLYALHRVEVVMSKILPESSYYESADAITLPVMVFAALILAAAVLIPWFLTLKPQHPLAQSIYIALMRGFYFETFIRNTNLKKSNLGGLK
jgi:NAD(P)H-quinone oxidoreductase subunit 5